MPLSPPPSPCDDPPPDTPSLHFDEDALQDSVPPSADAPFENCEYTADAYQPPNDASPLPAVPRTPLPTTQTAVREQTPTSPRKTIRKFSYTPSPQRTPAISPREATTPALSHRQTLCGSAANPAVPLAATPTPPTAARETVSQPRTTLRNETTAPTPTDIPPLPEGENTTALGTAVPAQIMDHVPQSNPPSTTRIDLEPPNVPQHQSPFTRQARGAGSRGGRRGRGGSLRGRGRRGRPRGTTNRGISRNDAASKTNAAQGWKMSPEEPFIVLMEDEFIENFFSQRIRLYLTSAMQRLRVELNVKRLPYSRSGVLILFIDQVLQMCVHWLNELLVLQEKTDISITRGASYKYLAVMLYSQCTGFSFKKSLTLLSRETGHKLDSTVLTFMHSNILAYSPTGRGDDESIVWNAQRDQTVMLAEFERQAFAMAVRVFLTPNHTVASLDDDLMGTRATDNQVKTISRRKADREGHTCDVVCEAFFRIVLQIRYHRRHEKRRVSVAKLLSGLLDSRGEQCLEGIVVAVDRGFARPDIIEEMVSHGVCCVGVMPESCPRCHPFVKESYLRGEREDDGTSPRDVDSSEEDATNNVKGPIMYDRPRNFVIDDSPTLGPECFAATKAVKPGDKKRKELHAVAVREHGTNKHCKVVRFMHCLQSPMKESMAL